MKRFNQFVLTAVLTLVFAMSVFAGVIETPGSPAPPPPPAQQQSAPTAISLADLVLFIVSIS
jgi:hypothetical protein